MPVVVETEESARQLLFPRPLRTLHRTTADGRVVTQALVVSNIPPAGVVVRDPLVAEALHRVLSDVECYRIVVEVIAYGRHGVQPCYLRLAGSNYSIAEDKDDEIYAEVWVVGPRVETHPEQGEPIEGVTSNDGDGRLLVVKPSDFVYAVEREKGVGDTEDLWFNNDFSGPYREVRDLENFLTEQAPGWTRVDDEGLLPFAWLTYRFLTSFSISHHYWYMMLDGEEEDREEEQGYVPEGTREFIQVVNGHGGYSSTCIVRGVRGEIGA